MPSPYFTTTPRYGLRSLLGTSNGSDIDAGFLAALDDVENAFAGYKSGTHAARLAATNLDGLLWRETDTGAVFLGTGSTWLMVLVGAWQGMTLGANLTGGANARFIGDSAQVDIGVIASASVSGTIATLPAGYTFAENRFYPAYDSTASAWFSIQTSGSNMITSGTALASGHALFFDGVVNRILLP